MKYAIFLGCTVPVRAMSYEVSARKVAGGFGIELIDIPEFSCCGYPVKSVHQDTTLLMAARNLSLAEEHGLDITTLCSACTSVLTEAARRLGEDGELLGKVNEQLKRLGRKYSGRTRVRHFARVLYEDVGLDRVRESVKRDISSLRIASHYGCHYLKPSEIYDRFDDPEVPASLDALVEAAGAVPVDYVTKKECCGGAILGVDENISLSMTKQKLDDISKRGADAINLVCPFCNIMYGANQRKIQSKYGVKYDLPVLYYPQVLGLAMGMEPEELALNMNPIKPKALLAKLG
ncbi:MAG: CoB--CoM heterodisulfide reductase iron-sulfur subunit B family protein [Firmicutes bacterium]|nr:CoB--CoM heterodisulfide reductase iron-sulfur subunit B family protein [Bacillota bacterium]